MKLIFKKITSLVLAALMSAAVAAGCAKKTEFDPNADFSIMLEQAKGTEVSFYGWGGDDDLNRWIDTELAPQIKEKYDIKLNRVPMDIDQILNKLSGEKQAGKEDGSIDIIWINGENFYSAKQNGYLYGPFTDKLPNFKAYIDEDDPETSTDFGYATEGFEAPYGKAEMVMINDSAKTPETPKNAQELMEFAKKYKGQVTYPALPDFTGSAFVRNLMYDIVGYDKMAAMPQDKAAVKETIQPAIDYLKELNQYLWNEGKTFPATLSQVNNMYADGELVMTMTYESYDVAKQIENGAFSDTSRSFIFDNGMIGNTNYIAVAANSPNKAGSLVVINEIVSPEMQASKYENVKRLPVTAYDKLSEEQKQMFDRIDPGSGTIPQSDLLPKRIPEIPAALVPVIEEIWLEEVVGK